MKFIPETNPLTKRFERSLRMANLDQARLVAEHALGRFLGDEHVRKNGDSIGNALAGFVSRVRVIWPC